MKKGNSILNAIQVLVIGLVILFFLLSASKKSSEGIDSSVRVSACQASIQAAHRSKYAGYAEAGRPKVAPNCPRSVFFIDKDILDGWGSNKHVKKEELVRLVGNKLVEAWKAIGRGRFDPRSDLDEGRSGTDEENMVFCLVWDEIVYRTSLQREVRRYPHLKEEFRVTFEDLCNTKIGPGSQQSYCDFLFGTGEDKISVYAREEDEAKYFDIEDGSQIVLRLFKPDLMEGLATDLRGTIAGGCEECEGQWAIPTIIPNAVNLHTRDYFIMWGGGKLICIDDGGNCEEDDNYIFGRVSEEEMFEEYGVGFPPQYDARVHICDRILN